LGHPDLFTCLLRRQEPFEEVKENCLSTLTPPIGTCMSVASSPYLLTVVAQCPCRPSVS
jgi:hypothetical protein